MFEVEIWYLLLNLLLSTNKREDDLNLKLHYPRWK